MISSLAQLVEKFKQLECDDSILVKFLAENDNSKNQVYFGSNFEALNMFPNLDLEPSPRNNTVKASLDFHWISEDGSVCRAPGAQLIFYPQYPEVRFSGFLQGCENRPSDLMNKRLDGRVLVLGISSSGRVLGFVVEGDSSIAHEIKDRIEPDPESVFQELEISPQSGRDILIDRLREIHKKGWIDGWRLNADSESLDCFAPNCGGYTLEAELGVIPNAEARPDFKGWEVKQYVVRDLDEPNSGGAITLMTPEPDCGFYSTHGVDYFVMKYGYTSGSTPGRRNFGGVHRYDDRHPKTELKMMLMGFNEVRQKITDINGCVALVDPQDNLAAGWTYVKLMKHWNKKHNKAAYVPSQTLKFECGKRQYHYGHKIRLCQNTDFILFLNAMADRKAYYDPGIKLTGLGTDRHKTKRRSQFRIHARNVICLYRKDEIVNLVSARNFD